MSLDIDRDKCTGCGTCVEECPGDVLRLDSHSKAFQRYPDDCWYCGACAEDCPTEAIKVIFPYLIR
jgi:NAD-dependent dihydropyrimidine dehydrogenase PreA subunit